MPNGSSHPALVLREHEGTRLVALSFDSAASPTFSLAGFQHYVGRHAYGWGFAWYPDKEGASLLVKDATSVGDNAMTKLLREWERFESTTFVAHLRGAARALRERDTQPFSRAYGGRDWVFGHNGDLNSREAHVPIHQILPLGARPIQEPIGSTDSEHIFCWLLTKAHEEGARSLIDIGWAKLHSWFQYLDTLGTANFVLSDGRDLVAYADDGGYNPLHIARYVPPHVPVTLQAPDFEVGLEDARERSRSVIVVSTEPLAELGFATLVPGQMVTVRRGAFIYNSHAGEDEEKLFVVPLALREGTQPPLPGSVIQRPVQTQTQAHSLSQADSEDKEVSKAEVRQPSLATAAVQRPTGDSELSVRNPSSENQPDGSRSSDDATGHKPDLVLREVEIPRHHYHAASMGEGRLLSVLHETIYRYESPVEKSFHLFRLQPLHDRWQDLLDFSLEISVDGRRRAYEDVFGNRVLRTDIEHPFTELSVRSESLVLIRSDLTYDLQSTHRRFQIPLVWMPWQRQMMTPYLLPPELPETQLRELSDYAMSFVERQDFDLVQTLLDMNTTIYRDYKYISGSTTMVTTPFDVFIQRHGVCQDFANLLICLARLLSIPARYRVGYIYTGGDYENKMQSDASHAWAELYLPWTGWQGFDPTNGCLVNHDHVRVACGRNYGDATPTSGTLYRGGGKESLSVEVKVEEVKAKA